MWLVIGMIRPGVTLNDIAVAAVAFVEAHGLRISDTFPAVGHGIGREHNDGWFIPCKPGGLNDGLCPRSRDDVQRRGVPHTPGSGELTFLDNDVASLVTYGAPASYWEHIIAVTDDGCEVLDLRAGEDASWGDATDHGHSGVTAEAGCTSPGSSRSGASTSATHSDRRECT